MVVARGRYDVFLHEGGVEYVMHYDVGEGKPTNVTYGIFGRQAGPVAPDMQARLFAKAAEIIEDSKWRENVKQSRTGAFGAYRED